MKNPVIRTVRGAFVALLLVLLPVMALAPTPAFAQFSNQSQAVTPQSLALSARQGLNDSILKQISAQNTRLAAYYAEAVNQWVSNKQQQKAGTPLPPIPAPPASWIAVPHVYTAAEKIYDARFPGIAPMIDDVQSGPPVAPQYVEPKAPPVPTPGTIVHVGQFLRDGQYAAFPDDNMLAGYLTVAPDGTLVRKVTVSTPFGVAQYYQSVQ